MLLEKNMEYKNLLKLIGRTVSVNEVAECNQIPYVLDLPRFIGTLHLEHYCNSLGYSIKSIKENGGTIYLDEKTLELRDLKIESVL